LDRTFRIFGRPTCKVCKDAKGKVDYFLNRWKVGAPVVYYNVDMPEGMAEGAWYDVVDIPTILLEEGDTVVKRWALIPPRLEELKNLFGAADDGQPIPEGA